MNPMDRDRPLPPPDGFFCYPNCRDPDHLAQAMRQFSLASNERYQPLGASTYCVEWLEDFFHAMGVYTPGRFYSEDGGVGVPIGSHCSRLRANDLGDWLGSADGKAWGWVELTGPDSLSAARQAARKGCPSCFTFKNPDPMRDGHVGAFQADGTIAQAGARFGYGLSLADVFGINVPHLRYFTHA